MDAARRLGRYTLGAKIGSGGSADVYEAEAEGADGFAKRLVVKRIRAELLSEPEAASTLRKEAMLARGLHHGNVVQVFDYGEDDDGAPYIVMEHVDGCSLRSLLSHLEARDQPLPLADALFVAEQIADALHYLHRFTPESGAPAGLVHRDVKPENILLSRHGVVKLTDFGIAKTRTLATETAPGFVKGTPRYLAPEQAAGRPLDGRADVYALGTVLRELCEASDCDGPTTIVDRAMELAPRDRYATALAFRSALETWRVEQGLRVDPDRLAAFVERAAPSSKKKPKVVSLDAALGLGPEPEAPTVKAVTPEPLAAPNEPSRRWHIPAIAGAGVVAVLLGVRLWPKSPSADGARTTPKPAAAAEASEPTEAEPVPKPEAPAPVPNPEPPPEPETAPEPEADPAPTPKAKTKPAMGQLRVNVLPYAKVRIDGKSYGGTPVTAKLPVGKHRVALENPQTGKTVRGVVVVSATGTTSIKTWDALK